MSSSSVIKLQDITKTYKLYDKSLDRLKESLHPFKKKYHKEFTALDKVSFSISKGEVIGIIGTNGSGKSTLLKIITHIVEATSGKIDVNGKITAILELGAGFNPELTGYENIKLHASLHGVSDLLFEKKIKEILKFADIGDFIDQPIKLYSSGMKARLGFAFLIHIDPEIFIVDEALSVGDAAFQRKCFAKIEEICKADKTTVLFVSHSEQTILQLCTRVILLNKGHMLYDGDPKRAFQKYKQILNDDSKEVKIKQEKKKDNISQKSEYFSKKLITESLHINSTDLAVIDNIVLLDSSGSKVNVLQKKHKYTFKYQVKYYKNLNDVVVSMRIKTHNGIKITGSIQHIEKVAANKTYEISFEFINLLNTGVYFFNCGTNTRENGEFTMLYQMLDCYMFEVEASKENSEVREIVDLIIDKKVC